MTFIGQTVLALIGGAHFASAYSFATREQWIPTRNEVAVLGSVSVLAAFVVTL